MRSGLRNDSGFSIIEVLVTAVLVVTVSLGVGAAFDSASATSGRERARSQASALAQQEQDRMKAKSPATLTGLVGTPQTRTVTLANQQYTITTNLSWVTDGSGAVSCSGPTSANYLQIGTTVSGAALNGVAAVKTDSLMAIPAGSSAGVLRVHVTDGQTPAQDVSGVTVTATSATGTTQNMPTNSAGCAIFTTLPSGTYTVTAQKTGYIDANGNSTPSLGGQDVSPAITTDANFTMDQSGTITATYWTNAYGWTQATSPGQQHDRLTTKAGGLTRNFGTARVSGSQFTPPTSITTGGLWPGATAVSPGECSNENYDIATPLYAATVTRGSNTAIKMGLPALNVQVISSATGFGSGLNSANVKLRRHADCAVSFSYALQVTQAVSGTNGRIPYPAVSPGTWDVCAEFQTNAYFGGWHWYSKWMNNLVVTKPTSTTTLPAPVAAQIDLSSGYTMDVRC